jgi:hypothetical protein
MKDDCAYVWKGRAHKYLTIGDSHLPCGRLRYYIRVHSDKLVRYSNLTADTLDGLHSCEAMEGVGGASVFKWG